MFIKTKKYGLINLHYIRQIHKSGKDKIALIAPDRIFSIKFCNGIRRDEAYNHLADLLNARYPNYPLQCTAMTRTFSPSCFRTLATLKYEI
jgi:hypothetical protein